MAQVIVTKEKHDDQILDASTPEIWGASALALLTERHQDGYWYLEPDVMYGDPASKLAELDGMLAMASDGPLRREIERRREKAERDIKEKENYAAWYAEMLRVVEEQDDDYPEEPYRVGKLYISGRAPIAWQLLEFRKDAEYEGVYLKEVRSPEGAA